MPSLHIEHDITDLETWQTAFDAVADIRRQAGVVHEGVRQPVDDPNAIVIDLDFDTLEHAEAFLGFLQTHIWVSPENAPALVGTPTTALLDTVRDSGQPEGSGSPSITGIAIDASVIAG